MNQAAAIAPPSSRPGYGAPAQALLLGAAVAALTALALEAWLRVPVRPLLDGYLQAVLGRSASLAAALRKLSL